MLEKLVGRDSVDVDDDAELAAQQLGLAERGGELDLVRPGARHHLGCAADERQRVHLNAARSLLGREPDDELEAVGVVLGEREDEAERGPDERTTSRFATVWANAPARRRISSCSSGVPSIEIERTSTSPASESQRLGVSSMPFEVTVVSIPSERARSRIAGNGP